MLPPLLPVSRGEHGVTPMASEASIQKLKPQQRLTRRYKAAVACTACRRRKLKCDGVRPVCSRCQKSKSTDLRSACTYTPVSASINANRLKSGIDSSASRSPAATSNPLNLVSNLIPTKTEHQSGDGVHDGEGGDNFSDGDPSEFSFQLKTTIDAKLGLPAMRKRCPMPLTDAAMFTSFSVDQLSAESQAPIDNVLPQRKHADNLIKLYWQNLESLEPLLDRERFFLCYNALFAGCGLACNERVFTSILNVIFALATQLQESVPPSQREEISRRYFLRAWSLLRPETSIWDSTSMELVQSLLLMARYLQCTNALHQTWMTIGSAVRISQSLGLHIADRMADSLDGETALLKRELWNHCINMDRNLSWSLGRMPMVPLAPHAMPASSNRQRLTQGQGMEATYLSAKNAELNEITGHIMLLQAHASSVLAGNLGLPQLSRNTDCSAAVQIDECLSRLSNSLPQLTSLQPQRDEFEPRAKGRLLLMRLRILHARIFLFRPMLVRFCIMQSQSRSSPPRSSSPSSSATPGLGDQILQSCASICVESAAKLVDLVNESHQSGIPFETIALEKSSSGNSKAPLFPVTPVSILPWWYRLFYLHVASQHLVAAMLRPDAFTATATQGWAAVTAALRAHEHISPSVGRCLRAFQRMWNKVMEIHQPAGSRGGGDGSSHNDADAHSNCSGGIGGEQCQSSANAMDVGIQDILQGLEFEADNPFFAMDTLNWPHDFDSET